MTAPVVPRKEVKVIRDSVIDLLDVIDENIESGYDGHCLNLRIVGGIIELALRAAEAAERERCAKIVEAEVFTLRRDAIAAAIRAMGDK